MSKKVDMFKASKEMSERVAQYMRVKVSGAILQTRYKREVSEWEEKIENAPRLLAGSIFEKNLPEIVAEYEAKKAEIKAKYDKLREEEEKFTLCDADNEFYKLYKDGKVKEGLIAWGKAWGLELEDTDFLGVLSYGIAGVRQNTAKGIITSGATEFTKLRTKGDVLKTIYALFAEKMLMVGTLKAHQLPEDVVEYYKKGKKSAK